MLRNKRKLYVFWQNNSGGYFEVTETLSHYVVVEAHSADHANDRARDLGIYFFGCWEGIDCTCCGDRWVEMENDEEVQSLYQFKSDRRSNMLSNKYFVVYRLNGQIQRHFYAGYVENHVQDQSK